MAKLDWDKVKRYKPTQEELERRERIKRDKDKLKLARKKMKETRNPQAATKKQMKFLRKNNLIKQTTKEVSFATAKNLINLFIKKDKKKKSGKYIRTNSKL
jgi:hypothetical protein